MNVPQPETVVDWVLTDVAEKVTASAQKAAEQIAADYDEPIVDRDVLTEHLTLFPRTSRSPQYGLRCEMWDAADEVLAAHGLPECVVEQLVTSDAMELLPERVAAVVSIDMAAVIAAGLGGDDAGEARADHRRTESAAITRGGR